VKRTLTISHRTIDLLQQFLFCALVWCLFSYTAAAKGSVQPPDSVAKFKEPLGLLWVNTYGNFRITDRLFWVAETHFRFQENDKTPFAGQIAQIYNRHAISYLYSKKFRASLGGVLRVNFNPAETTETNEQELVPEFRIWHEYLFAMPLSRIMIYHRLRIEHRWTRGFQEDSAYSFRNRWRYLFRMKIPLNTPKLKPGCFYLSPESELIMQSGKSVVGSPMEDLRLTTSLGYIVNPRLTFAAGFMYSLGQDLTDGAIYKQKHTIRLHMYYGLDFRKTKNKLPAIHLDE